MITPGSSRERTSVSRSGWDGLVSERRKGKMVERMAEIEKKLDGCMSADQPCNGEDLTEIIKEYNNLSRMQGAEKRYCNRTFNQSDTHRLKAIPVYDQINLQFEGDGARMPGRKYSVGSVGSEVSDGSDVSDGSKVSDGSDVSDGSKVSDVSDGSDGSKGSVGSKESGVFQMPGDPT
jgi:hypothetical protein